MTATTIALIGAGGKMGCRIADNLKDLPAFSMRYVEVGEQGLKNLAERGLASTEQNQALADADAVILAVPDRLIGSIAVDIVPQVKPGTIVIGLDPAAAYAGVMPKREDISYFVSHPCHPPLFGDDEDLRARTDWFGGQYAKQSIVNALYQGPDEHYAVGESIAKAMYAPILRSHRITVEQMAILEPGVVETHMATCVTVIKEAIDRGIEMGVPKEAAWDFCLGHLRTEIAIIFGMAGFPFSDGAKLAVEQAKPRIFREDWKKVLELEAIRETVRDITGS